MEINGFSIRQRSAGESWNQGNIIIGKNGKIYIHRYWPSKADRETKTAQQIGQDILADFYKTASIGAQGYSWYIEQFGGNYNTEAECKQAFNDYTRAHRGLMRLDPAGYKALTN